MKIQMKLLFIFLVVLILSITTKIILSILIATNNNKYNNIKYLLILILAILFMIKIILLLLMMFYFNTYEYLSSDNLQHHNKYNITNVEVYNQNYDKKWMKPYVSSNSDTYFDIDVLNEDNINKSIKNLISSFNNNYTIKSNDFELKMKELNINNIKVKNEEWKLISNIDFKSNKYNINYLGIKNKDIYNILNYFQSNFNTNINNDLNIYELLQYKILKYFKKNNIIFYEMFLVIFKKSSLNYLYNIHIKVIINKTKIIMNNIELISNKTSDSLQHGYENKYFKVTKDNNNEITFYNHKEILDKKLNDIENNITFREDNVCFDLNNNMINILNCEKNKNVFNKYKNIGILDRPCKSNQECKYFKSNKNYKNDFGKCENGYCQLPLGLKRIGYHFENNNSKPYCYNCETNEWLPNTTIDTCCDKQDKTNKNYDKKYDFLNSPDYYFKNDIDKRLNYNIKNNFKEGKVFYRKNFDNQWNWITR